MNRVLWLGLCLGLMVGPTAWAGDDDDLLDDEDLTPSGGKKPPANPPSPSEPGIDPNDDPTEDGTTPSNGVDDDDILDEDGQQTAGGGVDSDVIYRKAVEDVKALEPEDELQFWDEYLAKYPQSIYKTRIERRQEELEAMLYEGPKTGPGPDAQDEEIHLSIPLQLEDINPRTRLQAGFEWGLPDYINLMIDYQHAVRRDLAFHGGIRHRYLGWRLGGGVKYALVKSTRTQMLVTGLLDVEVDANPAYGVIRPQIAWGKKFGDALDLQVMGGVELETRGKSGVRTIGGANVTYAASPSVALFAEGAVFQQNLSDSKGALFYRFDTFGFGIKFKPQVGDRETGALEMNLGTSVPFTANYWQFHYGSIMGQGAYFLE